MKWQEQSSESKMWAVDLSEQNRTDDVLEGVEKSHWRWCNGAWGHLVNEK